MVAVNGKNGAAVKPLYGKGSNFHGKKRRSGAPRGNMNALKTGSGLTIAKRLTVGELPKKFLSVQREERAYRRYLESTVITIKGLAAKEDISDDDNHSINLAVAATGVAGINRWLLRNRLDTMSITEIRGCSQDILKAKQVRNAAVKQLGLNIKPEPKDLGTVISERYG
jgi:hypothetical protein